MPEPIIHPSSIELRLQAYRDRYGKYGMIGVSPQMSAMFDTIETTGPLRSLSVLIKGEPGVESELVARAFHSLGDANPHSFFTVDCAEFATPLSLDSRLFGHAKGAFPGADYDKTGLLDEARDGTLFLENMEAMPVSLQEKIVVALEGRSIVRLGGEEIVYASIPRLISASSDDLDRARAEARLRQDFYLHDMLVPIPALRERQGDVKHLAEYYHMVFSAQYRKNPELAEDGVKYLQSLRWPGNLSQFMRFMDDAVRLNTGQRMDAEYFKTVPLGEYGEKISAAQSGRKIVLVSAGITSHAERQLHIRMSSPRLDELAQRAVSAIREDKQRLIKLTQEGYRLGQSLESAALETQKEREHRLRLESDLVLLTEEVEHERARAAGFEVKAGELTILTDAVAGLRQELESANRRYASELENRRLAEDAGINLSSELGAVQKRADDLKASVGILQRQLANQPNVYGLLLKELNADSSYTHDASLGEIALHIANSRYRLYRSVGFAAKSLGRNYSLIYSWVNGKSMPYHSGRAKKTKSGTTHKMPEIDRGSSLAIMPLDDILAALAAIRCARSDGNAELVMGSFSISDRSLMEIMNHWNFAGILKQVEG